MTDKELLEFCEEHNVTITLLYIQDANQYRLRMERGYLRINCIFDSDSIGLSLLNEMEEKLTRMERVGEKEKNNDSD